MIVTMLRTLALGALAAMTLHASAAAAADAAADNEPRRLVVSGTGEVSAPPDMARIATGVVVQGETAGAALAENSKAMTAMLDLLRDAEVADKDIQTSRFAVTPLYERRRRDDDGTEPPRIVGYEVSNQVTVGVRDLDRLGGILDALVGAGANRMNGLSFAIADPKPLLDQARDAAVADALHKAERYANAAGVTLGPIVSIDEGGVAAPRPMVRAMEAMAADVPIATGETEISATVRIVFALD